MWGQVVIPGEAFGLVLGLLGAGYGVLFRSLLRSHSRTVVEHTLRKQDARASKRALQRARYTLERHRGLDSEPPSDNDDDDEDRDSGVFDAAELERARVEALCKSFVEDTPRAVPRPRRGPK